MGLSAARPVLRVLAAGLCLLLMACTPAPDRVVRVGLPSAPAVIDPRFATDATSWRVCRLLFEAPVDFDERFMPKPALMRWELRSPTRYRFTLQGEHRFSDGVEVGAEDVAATYRALLDPALASPHRGSLANLRRIEVIDTRTVDFELARADPMFPGVLVIGVLPARLATLPPGGATPPGSGAFLLASPPEAKRIALKRRSDGLRVDLLVVASETTRALKLARGELDLVQGGFAPENIAWLAAQPGVAVSQRAGTTFSYLGFNLAEGPTRDLAARRAVAFAIDRESIVTHVFRGQARLAESILIPEHWGGAPGLRHTVRDLPAARELLAGAGYTATHPLEMTYKTSSDPLRLRIATILQAQLAEAGIALRIQSYDWGTFYGDIKAGHFALYGLSWVGLQLPDIFRYAFHSRSVPPAGANRGRYASAEADALIDAAEASPSLLERAARYRELQDLLARELPVLPLWYEDFLIVRRSRLLGYDTNANGDLDALARVQLKETP